MSKKSKPSKPSKSAKGKSSGAAGGSGAVDWPEINRVLDFMTEHSLEEFEYGNGDLRIRLRRPGQLQGYAPVATAGTAPAASVAQRTTAPPAPAAPEVPAGEDLHTIKSPIVGTYYSAPSPDAAAFVKVGDSVKNGQVLCIIEAMKLMNEIESDVSGEVVKIFPENGHPVEYGEPLFAIRKK